MRASTTCSPSGCRNAPAQAWCAAHELVLPLRDVDIDAAAQCVESVARDAVRTLGYNKAEVTIGGVDTDRVGRAYDGGTRAADPFLHR
jgi:predicted flavoprotein YhiN